MEYSRAKSVDREQAEKKALLCAQVASAHKAENILIFNVTDVVSFADYFVICSGRSTRHVQGLAEHIEADLRQRRIRPMGVEGATEGQWVLLDFDDVIVHIFYQPVRAFYDLEGLWWEAPQVEFSAASSELPAGTDASNPAAGRIPDD
jgi:ribosome-associated protein